MKGGAVDRAFEEAAAGQPFDVILLTVIAGPLLFSRVGGA
jgi:hypothetical protein